jgi:replicative DNA helicase
MPIDSRQEQTLPLGVEAAADVIMELRRTGEQSNATSRMELELLKNRNGAPALFELQFHHERSLFSS